MSAPLNWTCVSISELSSHQLYRILQLRAEVFVVEQTCAYLDPDGKDLNNCWHLLAEDPKTNELLAYCRILHPGEVYPEAAIGRVVVTETFRTKGLGTELMSKAVTYCQAQWPKNGVALSAQCQWEGFYKKLGFHPQGKSYLEDGIPHIHMVFSD